MSGGTLDHIRAIAKKRQRLTEAQMEAESQYLEELRRQHFAIQSADWAALWMAYQEYRTVALPGFSTRWAAVFGKNANLLASLARNHGDAQAAEWVGCEPGSYTPAAGTFVVYVLFDHNLEPCYVGSSGDLRSRLQAHRRDGKQFRSWRAVRCLDRSDAYRVEDAWLRRYKPYLNRKAYA